MGSKRSPKWPNKRAQQPPLLHLMAYVLVGIAAISGAVCGGKTFYMHLLVQNVLQTPITEPPKSLKLDLQQHAADEMLLRQLVDECSQQQDTVIYLDSQRQLVVSNNVDPQHCPLMDIMLQGNDRSMGLCTDAALYVMHAGGRVIPVPADVEAYDSYCGPQTARLFLEKLYPQFVSQQKGVLHMQLVNTGHMWSKDAPLHAKMQAFICKTRSCAPLMQQLVVRRHYWASVWYLGHTSSDPSVGMSGDVLAQIRSSISHGSSQGYVIHVKSKSQHKQTKIVLDCWSHHPEFPPLVVVGSPAREDLSPASRSATNIIYYPPLASPAAATEGQSGSVHSSGSAGSSSQQTAAAKAAAGGIVDTARVKGLQAAAFLHVNPSLHAGFGHSINEGRAVGALVVTTNHQPMNELVTAEQGLLVPTVLMMSEKGTELGDLTHLDGYISADGLCQTVQKALALPRSEVEKKGAAAAEAYKQEQAAFLHRMGQLKAHLQERTAAAAGTDTVSAAAEAAAALSASIALASGSSSSSSSSITDGNTVVAAASSQRGVGGRRIGPAR